MSVYWAITWTNADFSSVRSSDIHPRSVSQEIPLQSITNLYFLHAKPWIPGGEISIFTAVIH